MQGLCFLANNSESKRTKYIDTKYHFIREYVECGVVSVIFVRSADNKADLFTKNVPDQIQKKHQKYLKSYE